ncbi:MAG: hypothetical protein K2Q32_01485 [Alphaproteobacteria bacterium]|nr:hypothetical protein [Alphaproteobacteria bacterium]
MLQSSRAAKDGPLMGARPPKLNHEPLTNALGGQCLPATLTREGRVRLLGKAFKDLLEGRIPSSDAALFLGGAGMAWLEQGGSFERDYLKVVKPKSHRTPTVIWREVQAHQDEGRTESDSE